MTTSTVSVPQDKVMLGITKAEFVKLPPVEQLVDFASSKSLSFYGTRNDARSNLLFRVCGHAKTTS